MAHPELGLLLIGVCIVAGAWLPPLMRRVPLSLSIRFVAVGAGTSAAGVFRVPGDSLQVRAAPKLLLEAVVIFALMSAGLKIDRPFRLQRWGTTWRLLALGMPLSVFALMGLAVGLCDLRAPVAWLLAAILTPTDPVLASIVEVGPPGQGEAGEIRFGLTSEAGFNDGLALPFVTLGLYWTHGRTLAELCELKGFIAVFTMALTLRAARPDHAFHRSMVESADAIGKLLTMLVLVAFGAWIASDLLTHAVLTDWLFAAALLLIVRPGLIWLCLLGAPYAKVQRALIASLRHPRPQLAVLRGVRGAPRRLVRTRTHRHHHGHRGALLDRTARRRRVADDDPHRSVSQNTGAITGARPHLGVCTA